jgi:prepilin-type N-terminal cleavage/methylation domain-containing protein
MPAATERGLASPASGCRRNRRGITLTEVLVAMVVLALFLAALAPMLSASALLRRQQELIAEATGLAQLEIEEIRRTWATLDSRSGLDTPQNVGGLVPVAMRDRVIPLPQPCQLSATTDPGCSQDPPVVPALPRLPPSESYPFPADGFEATGSDPGNADGPDDLYLFDPSGVPPDTAKAANFAMAGLRGPATYLVQVFWGYAPNSSTPARSSEDPKWYRNEIVRVVVRVYLAGGDGGLPRDSEGQPTRLTRAVRPVIGAKSRGLTDNSATANDPNAPPGFSPLAPLVVLTTDIPRVYQ